MEAEEGLNSDSELLNSDSDDEDMIVDSPDVEAGIDLDEDDDDDADDDDDGETESQLIKYAEVLGRINVDKYNYDEYVTLVATAQ